jgi:hypothetical protein
MNDDLRIARPNFKLQILRDALTDRDSLAHVIIALGGEAMDVDHRETGLGVWFEERFVAFVKAGEGAEEVDGGRGQVHHEVVDGLRDREDGGRWDGVRG